MKIAHIGYSDSGGGAFIAPLRLCIAQRSAGLDATYYVYDQKTAEECVVQLPRKNSLPFKLFKKVARWWQQIGFSVFHTKNSTMHSTNSYSLLDIDIINSLHCDVIHLHWINHNMLSIKDIGKIKKPIIWTLHDTWPYCGAEHLVFTGSKDNRYATAYKSKPHWQKGPDIPRKAFKKKQKYWSKLRLTTISPSTWQSGLVQKSYLALKNEWDDYVIANLIPNKSYFQLEASVLRTAVGLPDDALILGFGTANDFSSIYNNKGSHFLVDIVSKVKSALPGKKIHCVVFGPASAELLQRLALPVFFAGYIQNEALMNVVYNLCDIFLCTSLLESFSLTTAEAMFAGVPTVAFNASGPRDIIVHQETGYLAKSYDLDDFARGIAWCAENLQKLSNACISRSHDNFSESDIVNKHTKVYQASLQRFKEQS